jgi:hypothetical protein
MGPQLGRMADREPHGVGRPLWGSVPVSGRRRKVATLPCPTEHQEQCALFAWSRLHVAKYPDLAWLYAVPNGARTSMSTAKKLKAEGLRKGYPDIGLDVARGGYHGLRIELKRLRKSETSKEQRMWHDRLGQQGYYVVNAKGWQVAAAALTDYLQGRISQVAA